MIQLNEDRFKWVKITGQKIRKLIFYGIYVHKL